MKQKAKSIVTALLLGVLCAVTLSAVITVPDWETARADLLIGMQYETTGLDLDAVPGWLTALVMLHQNFPLDGWAWGPARPARRTPRPAWKLKAATLWTACRRTF